MRREYNSPLIMFEEFTPNEYVSACIVGNIQCIYPNDKNAYDDYHGHWWEKMTYIDGLPHTECGRTAPIRFSSGTASGFEVWNGEIRYNRPIYGITGYTEEPGTYYDVTWKSKSPLGVEYKHKGRLEIKSIDENRPNHS